MWSFAYNGTDYDFTQIGEMLLPGDSTAPITDAAVAVAADPGQ